MRDKHRRLFAQYTEEFPMVLTRKWEATVNEWNSDRTRPDPYQEPICCKLVNTSCFGL